MALFDADLQTLLNAGAIVFIYTTAVSLISYCTIKFYDARGHSIRSYRDPKFILIVNCHILLNLGILQIIDLLSALHLIDPFPLWATTLFSGLYLWSMIDILCLQCFWRSRIGNTCKSLYPLVLGIFLPFTIITILPLIYSQIKSSIDPLSTSQTEGILNTVYHSISSLTPFALLLIFHHRFSRCSYYDRSRWNRQLFATHSVLCILAAMLYTALSLLLQFESTLHHAISVENASEIQQIMSIVAVLMMLMLNLFHYPIVLVSRVDIASIYQSKERHPVQMSSELHELASNTANSVYTREPTRTYTPSSAPTTMGQMIDCLGHKESYTQFLQHLVC